MAIHYSETADGAARMQDVLTKLDPLVPGAESNHRHRDFRLPAVLLCLALQEALAA
jgi:hypothetical protein